MKRIFLSFLLVLAATFSMGQVSTKSTEVTFKDGAFSIQYINDGLNGAAAIKFNDLGWNNVLGVKNLSLNGLLVNPLVNTEQDSYLGGILNYRVYANERFSFNVGIGLKGLDITSLLQDGRFDDLNFNTKRQFIWSAGISVKL